MSKTIMKENIKKAQLEIEAKKSSVKNGRMRQDFHFMPQTGWLNDPNGLVYYKGQYHYFYQFYPYAGFWGSMHWGHAVSSDMLHWKHLPPALVPSEVYDDHYLGGCFSGSAIEYNGKLYLMYTGVTNNGDGLEQCQCIAWSEDGINFEKYEGNPVITPPEGVPKDFFRDPKVWRHEDTFYMVCGAKKVDKGQALLYKSKDMIHWEYFNVLAESRGEWGYMWECPDFYPLDDKYVLMFSPMGAQKRKCVYLVGDFDYQTGKFFYNISGEIDWGLDYYATQSFLAPDGRRIITGWANGWEWMSHWKDWGPMYQEGWSGFFTLPREVILLEDNTLSFKPIHELEQLRSGAEMENNLLVSEGKYQVKSTGCSCEIKVLINLEKTTSQRVKLKLRVNNTREALVLFDLEKAEMCFDRTYADGWSTGIARSEINLKNKRYLDIHIFIDRSSIEVFSNNYQNNMACNVFSDETQVNNYIASENGELYLEKLETWNIENVLKVIK